MIITNRVGEFNMKEITKIKVNWFKNIKELEIDLSKLNVVVGGNNSGKSSLLQDLHFKIMAAAVARKKQLVTFSYDDLLYKPANDFTYLRNEMKFSQGSESWTDFISSEDNYSIEIYKGRNFGNIGVRRSGNNQKFASEISNHTNLYSMYVPGLSGIALNEELKSKGQVKNKVAGGDANNYLRNIIYQIEVEGKLKELNQQVSKIFPGVRVVVDFNKDDGIYIECACYINGKSYPLELVGTGVLQAIQIFSYIVYFRPKLLLLDEPDSHLHPDNQKVLIGILEEIMDSYNTQIIISTHSRHILDAVYGKANLIWLNDGRLVEQGLFMGKLSLLMELGALDKIENLSSGNYEYIILTEDRKIDFIETLLDSNGLEVSKIYIHSYMTSSNIDQIEIAIGFLKELLPNIKIIVHRDRDFMLEAEVDIMNKRLLDMGGIPFITEGSDIEDYFTNPEHIAECLSITIDEANEWLNELESENLPTIIVDFTNKRNEIKMKMYKKNQDKCPDTKKLLEEMENPGKIRKGKFLLKKLNGSMYSKFGKKINLNRKSKFLTSERLNDIV